MHRIYKDLYIYIILSHTQSITHLVHVYWICSIVLCYIGTPLFICAAPWNEWRYYDKYHNIAEKTKG